jgi:hypothetical protein
MPQTSISCLRSGSLFRICCGRNPGSAYSILGCGDGTLTKKLVESGARVVGIDNSLKWSSQKRLATALPRAPLEPLLIVLVLAVATTTVALPICFNNLAVVPTFVKSVHVLLKFIVGEDCGI